MWKKKPRKSVKDVKKCENAETILPFSCCPLGFLWSMNHWKPVLSFARVSFISWSSWSVISTFWWLWTQTRNSNGSTTSRKERKSTCSFMVIASVQEYLNLFHSMESSHPSWNGQKKSLHSWRSLTIKSSYRYSRPQPLQRTSFRQMWCSRMSCQIVSKTSRKRQIRSKLKPRTRMMRSRVSLWKSQSSESN